jgi:hypothetical protein
MTQDEQGSPHSQESGQNALVAKILQISGAGFFLAGAVLAAVAATVGVDFVELPIPAPWLSVGLIAVGASDFVAAKVLANQQAG